MKKGWYMMLGLLVAAPVWADEDLSAMLNKVTLQLHAEKWVTTKTAQVNVGVNASVADAGIEKVQGQVLSQLSQLSAQSEWHIVSFTRQQDKSGLESIQISAQARLPQTDLATLRSKAKSLSVPGLSFTIDDVQFTPSDDEMTQANVQLRTMVYQQAKSEIDELNKMYPEQKYYLYRIDFNALSAPMPMVAAYRSNNMAAAAVIQPLNVGNKVNMTAVVTLAALPDNLAKKSPLINA